jgi:hypothetical protein
MMGAIFRADNLEYYSPQEINPITHAAMRTAKGTPQRPGAFSWRKYFPALALATKASEAERVALGDWHKELLEVTPPITMRYTLGRAGSSRKIKAKMAMIHTALRT